MAKNAVKNSDGERKQMQSGTDETNQSGRKGTAESVKKGGNDQTGVDHNPIQVAGRLFGALEYLAENGRTGLTELSEALKLNKSTVHRLMASLQYMNYVRQDPESGRYEATFKLVDLADHLMEHADVAQTVRPYLRRLMEKVQETVHLVERDGSYAIYIDKVESQGHSIRMTSRIGSRIPFYRSAVGKAMCAGMPDEEIRDLWEHTDIERRTPYTITNLNDFMEEIEEVRRKGYALDNEENETGLRCIAAPLALDGGTEYAFSISVPISRMDNDRIHELSADVLAAKEDMDRELEGDADHKGR